MSPLSRYFAAVILAFSLTLSAARATENCSNAGEAEDTAFKKLETASCAKCHDKPVKYPAYLLQPHPDAEADAPFDEALGGKTVKGTPIYRRIAECFPAETRDVFSQMDKVAGANGKLESLDFGSNQSAIRGRNTWLLWGGGNEVFWGWLQEQGFGLEDFLILLDSRNRAKRFDEAGLINQPGFKSSGKANVLGLYLDVPDGNKNKLPLLPSSSPSTGKPVDLNQVPFDAPPGEMLNEAKEYLKSMDDGIDPRVYGYPSGIFGLRLFLNPDFFGNTSGAQKARNYWEERVIKTASAPYYSDEKIHSDPKLIRPFRVSMSCGFCHVGPHPLNPPANPNEPAWENLSSIVGDQYWRPQPVFANLQGGDRFLNHFLSSQQPGTIDTSLVSTDWINNSNTINAIYDVPARLMRAIENKREQQSADNLRLPSSAEEALAVANGKPISSTLRYVPRVLFDGADSAGVFPALMRVPLNIGTYSEQWRRTSNLIIGFAKRRPFRIATCRAKSAYWQANERFRVPYEEAFFTFKNGAQSSTAPMKLANARLNGKDAGLATHPDGEANGADYLEKVDAGGKLRESGRTVFIEHCAICHSSKQPAGFQVSFTREMAGGWEKAPAPKERVGPHYTLPMDFTEWDAFKQSPAYAHYKTRIWDTVHQAGKLSGSKDPFIEDNFLASEIRIPVSLVGSNPARAMATNGMSGEVWDNFSSEDYKKLPPVGPLRYFNPFSGVAPDAYGNNAEFVPGGGGRGYYRPASLISLWATAPYLHNNTLGLFNNDPSVSGRLLAFEDGLEKVLFKNKRAEYASKDAIRQGDLRTEANGPAAGDPGFIYRVPEETSIVMPAPFIRPLIAGVAGSLVASILAVWIWVALFIIFATLAFVGRGRHVTFVLIAGASLVAVVFKLSGLASVLGETIWLAPALLVATSFAFYFWRGEPKKHSPRQAARLVFALLAIFTAVAGIAANLFINGRLIPLSIGPIPKGIPVNLIMNMDPESPYLPEGLAGLVRGIFKGKLVKMKQARAKGSKMQAAESVNSQELYDAFVSEAAGPLMKASKCPDFVLDRGHYFGEHLTDQEKRDLMLFLKTL